MGVPHCFHSTIPLMLSCILKGDLKQNFLLVQMNSTILYDRLMMIFCLQKVKKVYEAEYVSNRKLAQRTL